MVSRYYFNKLNTVKRDIRAMASAKMNDNIMQISIFAAAEGFLDTPFTVA